MFKRKIISLLFVSLLATSCGEEPQNDEIDKEQKIAILQSCASGVKNLNQGRIVPTREVCNNVDIQRGVLEFPTTFCYYASLLKKMNEFNIEKNVIEFTATIDMLGGVTTELIYLKFYKGRFYVYTATELKRNEESYYVYQIFDCHYNQSNNKMVNFVYFLGNKYGNPLIGSYEYKSGIFSCYYKRSEDDEALQNARFQELISEYLVLENEFNELIKNRKILTNETTIQKCVDALVESYNYVYKDLE